ncbi:MAG: hypothetical protein M1820_010115 [Bogoriella megaspora]|nr:MAG: hypothetical protein M1820_010115 [Bogoriella megaspora]
MSTPWSQKFKAGQERRAAHDLKVKQTELHAKNKLIRDKLSKNALDLANFSETPETLRERNDTLQRQNYETTLNTADFERAKTHIQATIDGNSDEVQTADPALDRRNEELEAKIVEKRHRARTYLEQTAKYYTQTEWLGLNRNAEQIPSNILSNWEAKTQGDVAEMCELMGEANNQRSEWPLNDIVKRARQNFQALKLLQTTSKSNEDIARERQEQLVQQETRITGLKELEKKLTIQIDDLKSGQEEQGNRIDTIRKEAAETLNVKLKESGDSHALNLSFRDTANKAKLSEEKLQCEKDRADLIKTHNESVNDLTLQLIKTKSALREMEGQRETEETLKKLHNTVQGFQTAAEALYANDDELKLLRDECTALRTKLSDSRNLSSNLELDKAQTDREVQKLRIDLEMKETGYETEVRMLNVKLNQAERDKQAAEEMKHHAERNETEKKRQRDDLFTEKLRIEKELWEQQFESRTHNIQLAHLKTLRAKLMEEAVENSSKLLANQQELSELQLKSQQTEKLSERIRLLQQENEELLAKIRRSEVTAKSLETVRQENETLETRIRDLTAARRSPEPRSDETLIQTSSHLSNSQAETRAIAESILPVLQATKLDDSSVKLLGYTFTPDSEPWSRANTEDECLRWDITSVNTRSLDFYTLDRAHLLWLTSCIPSVKADFRESALEHTIDFIHKLQREYTHRSVTVCDKLYQAAANFINQGRAFIDGLDLNRDRGEIQILQENVDSILHQHTENSPESPYLLTNLLTWLNRIRYEPYATPSLLELLQNSSNIEWYTALDGKLLTRDETGFIILEPETQAIYHYETEELELVCPPRIQPSGPLEYWFNIQTKRRNICGANTIRGLKTPPKQLRFKLTERFYSTLSRWEDMWGRARALRVEELD